jgi:hypothetical protein
VVLILSIFLCISGCQPAVGYQSSYPSTTKIKPSLTDTAQKPTPSRTPIITIASTLSAADAEKALIALSRDNGGCFLPCFWGFTPGIDKMEAYSSFLKKLDEISPSIELVFPRGDLLVSVYATAQGGYKGNPETIKWFDIDFRVYQKKETKENMIYGNPYYSEYFQSYTLPYLLSTYGPPENAYIVLDTGIADMGLGEDLYILHLDYPKQGWVAHLQMPLGQKNNKFIGCPSDAFTSLRLWSPSDPARDYELNPADLFTIEEATGMTIGEFYQQFKDPSNTACLETPSDIHK